MEEFKTYFRHNYSHVEPQISDADIERFLSQDHIKDKSLDKKADLFCDYLLANDLAEVQE